MSEDYSGDNARYPHDMQRGWGELATGDRVAVLLVCLVYLLVIIFN